MIKVNISDLARLRKVTSAELYRRGGRTLQQEIREEFERLLIETPQYSGTTVASYRIGPGYDLPDAHDTLPEPESAEAAFYRGHMTAVYRALDTNEKHFKAMDNLEVYKRQDLVVKNDSPQWEIVEKGPVRPINEPGLGSFAKFVARLDGKIIEVDLGDL